MRRKRPARITVVLCWIWLLAVVGVWLLLRLAGDRWWWATLLLLGPRWVWVAPVVVLLPLMLAVRPRLSWMPLLVGMLTAILLGGFRWSFSREGGWSQCDIRLLTCNVHRQKLDAPRLAELMAAVQPHIVALQDWSAQHQHVLFADGDWHLHREGELLFASRYPIRQATRLNLRDVPGSSKARRGVAVKYELLTPRGPLHLINLHLASPHLGLMSILEDGGGELRSNIAHRRVESQTIRDEISRLRKPLLVAGDFNTPEDSMIFRAQWSDLVNAFAQCGRGFGYTYVTRHTQLRIDHILADSRARAVRCWVGPSVGSPHRPLVAEFRWP